MNRYPISTHFLERTALAAVVCILLLVVSILNLEFVAAQTEPAPEPPAAYDEQLRSAIYEAETVLTELQGLRNALQFYLTFLNAKGADTSEAALLLSDATAAIEQISIFLSASTVPDIVAQLAAATPADRQSVWLAHHQAYRLMRIHMNEAREKLVMVVEHLLTIPQ